MKYIFLILLTGCGFFESKDNESKDPYADKLELVRQKRDTYCSLSKPRLETLGYAVARCDGLLFTSLHALACGTPSSLSNFEDNGRWYRSPDKSCFKDGKDTGSDSTISKDMISGMTLYQTTKGDRAAVERFVKYCEDNKRFGGLTCKIGDSEGDIDAESKVYYPTTSLGELKEFLGKSLRRTEEANSEDGVGIKPGFKGHLEVLGILRQGVIFDGIGDSKKDKLEQYAKAQPNNALYVASAALYKDGDMNAAADLLLDEKYFPADKLPTSENYCTHYLYERDYDSKDWASCEDGETHFGTDFAFAATVLLGEVR